VVACLPLPKLSAGILRDPASGAHHNGSSATMAGNRSEVVKSLVGRRNETRRAQERVSVACVWLTSPTNRLLSLQHVAVDTGTSRFLLSIHITFVYTSFLIASQSRRHYIFCLHPPASPNIDTMIHVARGLPIMRRRSDLSRPPISAQYCTT